jgi:acetyl esterase/lipase
MPAGFISEMNADGAVLLRARAVPIPTTVSAAARQLMATPYGPEPAPPPATAAQWKACIEASLRYQKFGDELALSHYPMPVEHAELAGVKVQILTPPAHNDESRRHDHVLINLHGGAFVAGAGSPAEALPVAAATGIRTLVVDYRMPPDHPFPAALEDIAAVYRELLRRHRPEQIGFFGASAGGNLCAAATLYLRQLGLPPPAALGIVTPAADLSQHGDSWHVNAGLDRIMTGAGCTLAAAALALYIGANDPTQPLLSPVFGDFGGGFPPALLITGTRDLLLSDTVRLHRALRRAGVDADLHVFEGMWHSLCVEFALPEHREYCAVMAEFFGQRLGAR